MFWGWSILHYGCFIHGDWKSIMVRSLVLKILKRLETAKPAWHVYNYRNHELVLLCLSVLIEAIYRWFSIVINYQPHPDLAFFVLLRLLFSFCVWIVKHAWRNTNIINGGYSIFIFLLISVAQRWEDYLGPKNSDQTAIKNEWHFFLLHINLHMSQRMYETYGFGS